MGQLQKDKDGVGEAKDASLYDVKPGTSVSQRSCSWWTHRQSFWRKTAADLNQLLHLALDPGALSRDVVEHILRRHVNLQMIPPVSLL